jgi:hypothetical protein
MKNLYILMVVAFIKVSPAAAEESEWLEKKIHKGDWNLGGGGSLAYDSFNGLNGSASISAQYFFWDRLSLGAVGNYRWNNRLNGGGIGPKGTYYFYETEKKAFYISQNLNFSWYDFDAVGASPSSSVQVLTGQSSIGFEHFFAPNISFGPEIRYSYYLEKDKIQDLSNEIGVYLNFNLYF